MGDASVRAIRHGVALARLDRVSYFRGRSADSWSALDALCSSDLFVKNGQIVHGLMLDGAARPLVDAYVGCDGDVPLVLCEFADAGRLVEHAGLHGIDASGLADVTADFDLWSLDGPYAWELLGEWVGPDVTGLPYLTFFHLDEGICFRAGKTGEYGYLLLLRKEVSDAVALRLTEIGVAFELARADAADLDLCALENAFFTIRAGSFEGLTPLELQLQWRISSRKKYVGYEALLERRRAGPRVRSTYLISDSPVRPGDRVVASDGAPVGKVHLAAQSPVRGDWVATALLDVAYAYPGVDQYRLEATSSPVRTVSPPVINNRSLYVDPRRHSFRYRGSDDFPPVVPDR